MMLYIVRHAIAAPIPPEGPDSDDSQRPLTAKGRTKMFRIAQGLKELGASIDLILTSPYLRATQTARILAKKFELGKDKILPTEALSPAGQFGDLVSEINAKCQGLESLALVGHEPYLSRLASLLISGDSNLSMTLKKGGVCCLSIDKLQAGRCATLEWLLTPAQLVGIGG